MIHLIFLYFVLTFTCIFRGFAQSWEIVAVKPMPERVTNNTVTEGFIDGTPYVYSFGGLDSTQLFSGIHQRSYRYNVVTDIWESIPPLPDTLGKIAMGASHIDNIIYIIGGYHVFKDGHGISSDKVHRYDVVNNTYLPDGTSLPVAVDDHVQCVWRDSLIFVISGWSHNRNIPDVQIYNPATDTWMMGTPTPNNDTYTSFGASGVILGDTIYYFGGASDSKNFPIQNNLRIGVIDVENPMQIDWSDTLLDPQVQGYRMAATSAYNNIYWIGGSGTTYNYDGIAYNDSKGVHPLNRILCFVPFQTDWYTSFTSTLPMDVRGVANIAETIKYTAGGMLTGQKVSNKTFRLIWNHE